MVEVNKIFTFLNYYAGIMLCMSGLMEILNGSLRYAKFNTALFIPFYRVLFGLFFILNELGV